MNNLGSPVTSLGLHFLSRKLGTRITFISGVKIKGDQMYKGTPYALLGALALSRR